MLERIAGFCRVLDNDQSLVTDLGYLVYLQLSSSVVRVSQTYAVETLTTQDTRQQTSGYPSATCDSNYCIKVSRYAATQDRELLDQQQYVSPL